MLADPAHVAAAVTLMSPSGQQPLRVVSTENVTVHPAAYRRDIGPRVERNVTGLRCAKGEGLREVRERFVHVSQPCEELASQATRAAPANPGRGDRKAVVECVSEREAPAPPPHVA